MTPADFIAARQSLGLTQQAMADHLGRSRSIVQQWEHGRQPVDPLAARYMTALLAGYRPDDWPGDEYKCT